MAAQHDEARQCGQLETQGNSRDRRCIRDRQSDGEGGRRSRDEHKRAEHHSKRKSGAAASRGTGAAANLRLFRNIGPRTGGPRPARRRRDSARRWRCLRDRQEALEPALERLGPVHGVRPQLLGRQREHGPPAGWRQDDLPADIADPSLQQGGKGLDVYHSTHHSVSVQPADSHRWGQVRPQGGVSETSRCRW